MDDVNRTTRNLGIVEIGSGMARFGECRRTIIPGAQVGASRIHETLLQDAGNLPILAMQQRNRWSPQFGYGIESCVNTPVVKCVGRPRWFPRPLHLQVKLERSDAVLFCQVGNLSDMFVGAEDRRQKQTD